MSWFNPAAIVKEISKIRWPKRNDLLTNSVQVFIFTSFFSLYFFGCQFLISLLLRLVGVIR